jgi:hypothetical protein
MQYASVVSIAPISGMLPPNGSMQLSCTFAPYTVSRYILKIPCYFHHEDIETEVSKKRTSLNVTGLAVKGIITSKPEIVDFQTVLVNTISERDITLFNTSDCDIFYSVEPYMFKDGEIELLSNKLKESEIEVFQKTNVLPARSHETVKVKICLKNEKKYDFRIYYKADTQQIAKSEGLSVPLYMKEENDNILVCSLQAIGVHPLLMVTDIRTEGISKTLVWSMFSLAIFNKILQQVKPDIFAYTEPIIDDNSFPTDSAPVIKCSELDFDFGATSIDHKPTNVYISLHNKGVVPVDWIFKFLNDLDVDIKHWVDPGDYTEEQVNQNFILDNSIFEISPRAGNLKPNETIRIQMTYTHKVAGAHSLPVVFRLKNGASRAGKEVFINFVGYTIPKTQKFLHHQSPEFEFQPIKIGSLSPPIQLYHLMNRGMETVRYIIDTSLIDKLNNENENFEILKCLKKCGSIEPGTMDYLEFIFQPLEARNYEVDITITVENGKTKLITLKGTGISDTVSTFENKADPHIYPDNISISQDACATNQTASLSLERINFYNVPVNTIMRQVVVVQNNHKEQCLSFKWIIPSTWPLSTIQVMPKSGKLEPGECRVCKVIFTPNSIPRMWEYDIVCETIYQNELDKYNLQVEVIKAAINEDKGFADLAHLHNKIGGGIVNKLKPLPAIQSKLNSYFDKSEYIVLTAQDTSNSCNAFEVDNITSPKTSHLFLSIIAQTFIAQEFVNRFLGYEVFFESEIRKFVKYVDPAAGRSNVHTFNIIQQVMLSLLGDIFHEPDVVCLPFHIASEPCPFYDQISRKKRGTELAVDGNSEFQNSNETIDYKAGPLNNKDILR